MKQFFISLSIIFYLQISAQDATVIKVRRFMSLGEHYGLKVTLPSQEAIKVEKITRRFIKDRRGSITKQRKNTNELAFTNVFLKDIIEPYKLYVSIEQEGYDVGWTGFFFREDGVSADDSLSTYDFLTKIYQTSMFNLYSDSIDMLSLTLKAATKALRLEEKNHDQAKKSIFQSKDNILNAKKEIKDSEAILENLNANIDVLTQKAKTAKDEFKNAKTDKAAKLSFKVAKKNLNNAERKIQKEQKNIQTANHSIMENKENIKARTREIENFQNKTRIQLEKKVSLEKEELKRLIFIQNKYK